MPKSSTTTLNKPLIGVAGSLASGKDTVCTLLASRDNFRFISMTDPLRQEAKNRGLLVNRENLRTISAQLRRDSGNLGILVDRAIDMFVVNKQDFAGLVIASLRNPGEVDAVHNLGGVVVWVDANPRLRYQRIMNNDRGRSGEDDVTFEQFIAQEKAEESYSGDQNTLNLRAVSELSDYRINNDGDIEDLYQVIKSELGPYLSSFSK